MKRLLWIALVLAVPAASSAAVRDPYGPRGAWTALVKRADVRKVLGLTPRQRKTLGALSPARDDNRQAISRALKAGQLSKLKRRSWREQGGYALFDPELAKQLKITDEQQIRLEAAAAVNLAEYRKLKNFLTRARFRSKQAMEKYIAGYRNAADKRLLAVLTAAQTKMLRSIVGRARDTRRSRR